MLKTLYVFQKKFFFLKYENNDLKMDIFYTYGFFFKQALISLFELPPDENTLPEDHFIEVDDTPSYQPQYAQLTCAKNNADDPLASK